MCKRRNLLFNKLLYLLLFVNFLFICNSNGIFVRYGLVWLVSIYVFISCILISLCCLVCCTWKSGRATFISGQGVGIRLAWSLEPGASQLRYSPCSWERGKSPSEPVVSWRPSKAFNSATSCSSERLQLKEGKLRRKLRTNSSASFLSLSHSSLLSLCRCVQLFLIALVGAYTRQARW